MKRLGLKFTFWDATRPEDVKVDEMRKRLSAWARPLRPAEVACLVSHRTVWASVAQGIAPVLVMEDDAVLSRRAPSVLPKLAGFSNLDLINLETFREQKLMGTTPISPVHEYGAVFPLYRDRGGAACYLLWPSGAAKLLSYTERFSPLADAAINLAPDLRRQQLVPALAIQEMHLTRQKARMETSTVSLGKRPSHTKPTSWMLGRAIRLYCALRIAAVTGRYAFSATARYIPFADD